jgi:hypothetical protein
MNYLVCFVVTPVLSLQIGMCLDSRIFFGSLYTEILDTKYTQLPIGSKTLSDIQSFLREHDHNLAIYRVLFLLGAQH